MVTHSAQQIFRLLPELPLQEAKYDRIDPVLSSKKEALSNQL